MSHCRSLNFKKYVTVLIKGNFYTPVLTENIPGLPLVLLRTRESSLVSPLFSLAGCCQVCLFSPSGFVCLRSDLDRGDSGIHRDRSEQSRQENGQIEN